MLTVLDASAADFDRKLARLLARGPAGGDDAAAAAKLQTEVAGIITAVRARGDDALVEFTAKFDRFDVADAAQLEVPRAVIDAAADALASESAESAKVADALRKAAARIKTYHEREAEQSARDWHIIEADGTRLGQRVTALQRVGVYVPGGQAAYPSSALMTVIPAKVAGVGEVVMTVPAPGGELNRAVLAAAQLAGVDRVFTIGGAQAIAALAYSTATVPGVDKIVGPGNRHVTEAKRQVFGKVGIDMLAGPSEVAVVCDAGADPAWVALDLFAQAEHDANAQAIAITDSADFAAALCDSIERLLPQMTRRDIIVRALADHGAVITVADLKQAVDVANRIAPEHLELCVARPGELVAQVQNAGAIFVGRHNAEALGDYCAGPNHVLPTAGAARFSSPLGVGDFRKTTSVIEASREGAAKMAAIAATLARAEGLDAHALAAEYRLGDGGSISRHPPQSSSPSPPQSFKRGRLDMNARGENSGDGDSDNAIDARIAELVRGEIRDASAYQVAPADGLIKLDAMENPYPPPAELRRRWLERMESIAINRYPDPNCQALKERLRATFDIDDGVAITLGNGSDELLQMLALLVSGAGGGILAPTPTFSMYQSIAAFTGVEFTGVPLRDDFTLDADALLDAIRRRRPAIVFLAYPNNPTGNCFDETVMLEALARAPGLVVVDEAYFSFCRRSFAAHLARFPHLMILRTLSKSGLAALRLGFLMAHPKWASQLEKIRLPYNISALTQHSAGFFLENHGVMQQQAVRIIDSRAKLFEALNALPLQVFPSEANFILFRVGGDADKVYASLKSQGVLIKNLHAADSPLLGCLRVTVGSEEENARFVGALRKSLES